MENIENNFSTLFWKSLNEITEFKQDYTGDIVSADGDSTSDKNQDYQIVYGITPKSRTQFIKSWDKMIANERKGCLVI